MLIRIVKDWQYPANFFKQTPAARGVWDDITFTEEKVGECDYLIVLQRPPYDIKVNCPSGNTWLITQEPPVDYFQFYSRSFAFFDKVFSYYKHTAHDNLGSLQPVLPWHVFKSYDELISITTDHLVDKRDELTWITSNKSSFPGHKARMLFKDYLLESKFHFHLYGSGFNPIHDKFDGLFPFKYALAIENYCTDHYWTEKIADSFLSWCLPFYWGANNLEDYFPSDSFIRIDINEPGKALKQIQDAIQNKEWEKRLDSIKEARRRVLNEYQFFPYISKLVKEDAAKGFKKANKDYFIPCNPYPRSYKIRNQFMYYKRRVLSLFNS
jgi:Glycosyltransferase family 10 (fucosyltransferase) C-term